MKRIKSHKKKIVEMAGEIAEKRITSRVKQLEQEMGKSGAKVTQLLQTFIDEMSGSTIKPYLKVTAEYNSALVAVLNAGK
jgi:Zn finger protein HypA/HybF involved in hydrogenase expression